MVYLLTVKCKVFQILTYIRHERPTERYRNTVKDGFFYRILLPRRMKNRIPAGLDDTAIPHIKIKITEIPLEKKNLDTAIPQTPMFPSPVGNVRVLLTESKSWNLFNAQNWIYCVCYDQRKPSPCKVLSLLH